MTMLPDDYWICGYHDLVDSDWYLSQGYIEHEIAKRAADRGECAPPAVDLDEAECIRPYGHSRGHLFIGPLERSDVETRGAA